MNKKDKQRSNSDPVTPLLQDPERVPTSENLEDEFGPLYPLYLELVNTLEGKGFGLGTEWRYYKDGKAWLCKITRKKKTVVWMSAWKDFLRLGFYFTEKTGSGIADLEIDPALKQCYATADSIGRLKPLSVDLKESRQLPDIYTLMKYKISRL